MQLKYHMYCNATGYSIAAQEYILAMLQTQPDLDIKTQFYNPNTTQGVSPTRHQLFTGLSKKPDSEKRINFFHSIPPRYRPIRGMKNIGFTVFETVNPPKAWVSKMNEMDMIITCSAFNKGTFEANGVKVPITVIPHTFDPLMFHGSIKSNGRYDKKTFLALGTWKKRKNWECLIKGFYDAFEKKDNVCLLAKTDRTEELKKTVEHIKKTSEWRTKDTAPIFAVTEKACSFEEIPSFMKRGDYYITVSHGEGFCLPALHAMALGIPVLVPRFGGVLEFANADTATWIEPYEYKKIPSMDGVPQFSNAIWPLFQVTEVAQKMKEVYNKNPLQKTAQAYRLAHASFTYSSVGKRMIEAIYG